MKAVKECVEFFGAVLPAVQDKCGRRIEGEMPWNGMKAPETQASGGKNGGKIGVNFPGNGGGACPHLRVSNRFDLWQRHLLLHRKPDAIHGKTARFRKERLVLTYSSHTTHVVQ